jgi:hypothetical protein
MFKVNLETELLKQPASKVSASELLYIQEYDRLGPDVSNSEILSRIGINKAIETGKKFSETKEKNLRQAQDFNLDKVFHISQIESLCKKYYLRFLPSALFNGSIDSALPDKIATFEAIYGVRCKSEVSKGRWVYEKEEKENNTFIAAPMSSFKLEEKPKDPLLFYKINDEYYYLIHKWGNDLSMVRRFYNLLSSPWLVWFLIALSASFAFSGIHLNSKGDDIAKNSLVLILIMGIMNLVIGEGGIRLLPKNDITSRYIKE